MGYSRSICPCWATTADRFPIALRTAQAALRADRGAEAQRAADRALAIEPHSPHAWAERAAAQLTTGARSFDGALVDAQHALRLFADHPGARRTRATMQVLLDAVRRQSERPRDVPEERER